MDVFDDVSKLVLRGRSMLWQRFQKMSCIFRDRRSILDVAIFLFRGRRSTSDVSCCVFSANRIGRAAPSGNTANCVAGVAICEMCGKVAESFAVFMGEATKPFLFEVVKVSKLEEVSHEMLVFRLPHVSS